MDTFSQTFLNFMNGAQVYTNSSQGLTKTYDHNQEAYEYELLKQIVEKPLETELEILRHRTVLVKDGGINNYPSFFDPEDEAQKILKGYYINIDESLNIFKIFHDNEPNPFSKFNTGASEYIKFLQEKSGYNLTNIFHNWNQLPQKPEEPDSDQLIIDTSSEKSCLNISDSGIEAENNSPVVCTVVAKKKLNFDGPAVKKQTKRRRKIYFGKRKKSKKVKEVKELDKNIYYKSGPKKGIKPKINLTMTPSPPEIPRHTSTPNKTPKMNPENPPNLESLLLSPIYPTRAHKINNSSTFSIQEIQGLQHQDDIKYLEFLEKQFSEAVFEENGRTIYPIVLNRDFKGITYDMEDELNNNQHIKIEFFSKFRKM